jgi:hypothetical protein
VFLTVVPGLARTASGRSLEELEHALARTPPVSTRFVEYRFSHLMKKPLRTSGTLEYRADGVMTRKVETPFQETTDIEGDTVRIARAGRAPRTISLQRAPQLRVLLGSFRALLEGKLTPLASDFDITLEDHEQNWTLTLQPHDARLAKQLDRIRVFGIGDRPTCLEALEPDGDAALTLFDAAPAGDASASREQLDQHCHAPVTRAT